VVENELVISANTEDNKEELTENYARREFSKRSFEKRFQLNTNEVDIENIDAKYNAGVLTIDLPKVHKEETKKLVQVN
jgi:HSP20 family protein